MRKHKTVYSTIMTTTKMTETEGFLCIIEILCKLLKYKGWNQILKQPPKKTIQWHLTNENLACLSRVDVGLHILVWYPSHNSVRARTARANGIVGSIHANFSKSSVGILCVATFRRISNSRHFVVMLNYSTIL